MAAAYPDQGAGIDPELWGHPFTTKDHNVMDFIFFYTQATFNLQQETSLAYN